MVHRSPCPVAVVPLPGGPKHPLWATRTETADRVADRQEVVG